MQKLTHRIPLIGPKQDHALFLRVTCNGLSDRRFLPSRINVFITLQFVNALTSPGTDMVQQKECPWVRPFHSALSSPGIFGSADEPKTDLLTLERRHGIPVDQRHLSPRMVVHPVDATRGDEVARLDDKVFHFGQYRRKELCSECQNPDGVLSRL
jgi:hypothetical protein